MCFLDIWKNQFTTACTTKFWLKIDFYVFINKISAAQQAAAFITKYVRQQAQITKSGNLTASIGLITKQHKIRQDILGNPTNLSTKVRTFMKKFSLKISIG